MFTLIMKYTASLSLFLFVTLAGAIYFQEVATDRHQQYDRVQYAEALLALARVELQEAVDINTRVPNAFSDLAMERLRANVAAAQKLVTLAQEGRVGDMAEAQLAYTQAKARGAQLDYRLLQEQKRAYPDWISSSNAEKVRLRAFVADLRLRMWRSPDYAPSTMDQMQWQIDRLGEEVLELHRRLERVENRR